VFSEIISFEFRFIENDFGGHYIKKSEPISSRILTDFARSACVVALAQIFRPDCAGSAPAAREYARGQPQKFPCIFLAPPPPTPPPRSGKRNGKKIFEVAAAQGNSTKGNK